MWLDVSNVKYLNLLTHFHFKSELCRDDLTNCPCIPDLKFSKHWIKYVKPEVIPPQHTNINLCSYVSWRKPIVRIYTNFNAKRYKNIYEIESFTSHQMSRVFCINIINISKKAKTIKNANIRDWNKSSGKREYNKCKQLGHIM